MTDVSAVSGVRRWTGGDIWARYIARAVDGLFLGWIPAVAIIFAVGFGVGLLRPDWLDSPNYEVAVGLAAIVAFVLLRMILEAFMLAAFGRTPGKALMGLSVRRADGERAGFWTLMWRQLLIAFYGYGLFVPIVSLITLIMSFSRLGERRRTKWDEVLKLEAHRNKVGWLRYGVGVVLWLVVVAATAMLNMIS